MALFALLGQPSFGIERRGATGSGRRNGLPVVPVNDVTRGKDTGDRGPRGRLLDQQVTIVVGGELTLKQFAAWIMPDRYKDPGNGQNALCAGLRISQPQTLSLIHI